MRSLPLAAMLLALLAAPAAFAQGVSVTPAVPADAPAADFIQAALHALAAGRNAAAQEAIERAETRLLDRSVKPSLAGEPNQQQDVTRLAQARQALAAGDRLGAVTLLEQALQAAGQ
jgi:hypothetical protein